MDLSDLFAYLFRSGLSCGFASEEQVRVSWCLGNDSALTEQCVELLLAEGAAKFYEGEERKEGAEYDDRPSDQLVGVGVVPDRSERLAAKDAFDELLDEVEDEDEQTIEE